MVKNMKKKKNNNNSSNALVFGRWPQTKIPAALDGLYFVMVLFNVSQVATTCSMYRRKGNGYFCLIGLNVTSLSAMQVTQTLSIIPPRIETCQHQPTGVKWLPQVQHLTVNLNFSSKLQVLIMLTKF